MALVDRGQTEALVRAAARALRPAARSCSRRTSTGADARGRPARGAGLRRRPRDAGPRRPGPRRRGASVTRERRRGRRGAARRPARRPADRHGLRPRRRRRERGSGARALRGEGTGRDPADGACCSPRSTSCSSAFPSSPQRAAGRAALLPGPLTLVVPNPARRYPWLNAERPDAIGVRVPAVAGAAAVPCSTRSECSSRRARTFPGGPDPRRVEDVPRGDRGRGRRRRRRRRAARARRRRCST